MNNSIQSTIILLIEQIVVALGGEFKLYLPQLIPHMLRVFMHDNSQSRIVSVKVSGNLQEHAQCAMPQQGFLLVCCKQRKRCSSAVAWCDMMRTAPCFKCRVVATFHWILTYLRCISS